MPLQARRTSLALSRRVSGGQTLITPDDNLLRPWKADAAAAKLDKMEKDSGSAWNDAKQGFADAYRDLQNAYDKAVGQFK